MSTTYFSDDELRCKCDRGAKCDAKAVDLETRMKAEGVRRELGESMIITSASRCVYWNGKVGGAPESFHPKGMAIDVKTRNAEHAARIIVLAIKHGFTGIGVNKIFVHLDTRPGPLKIFTY